MGIDTPGFDEAILDEPSFQQTNQSVTGVQPAIPDTASAELVAESSADKTITIETVDPDEVDDQLDDEFADATQATDTAEVVTATTVPGTQPLADASTDPATARIEAAMAPTDQDIAAAPSTSPPPDADGPSETVELASLAPAKPAPKRTGIFARLFNNERVEPPAPVKAASAEPVLASTAPVTSNLSALPGVDRDRALGTLKQSTEESLKARIPDNQVRVASAAGLARLAPNGLKTQHSGVDVKCLKPALVKVLKQVESKYGKPVIVTSGYRSPERNRKARGAKNSLHIYCAAADIQVEGVDKWSLASYLRTMPGRGGVGTYCHTKSVHIDIGPRRDWNARCRRR